MKNFKKLSVLLLTLCAIIALAALPAMAENDVLVDPVLILSPEASLTVFVDGTESAVLSDKYPFGETATVTAPAVAEKTFQYWTNAEGAVISYDADLTLNMYANTTVNAVYGTAAATAQTTAAFLNVTRTTGEIVFNAIASAPSGSTISASGIRYSTTKKTLNELKGEDDVTVAPSDGTPNWMLSVTPTDEDTTYYAVVYATVGEETTYSAVKAVKLAELQSSVSMVTNLGDIDLSNINTDLFCVVTFDANGGEGGMEPQGMVKNTPTALSANIFTREGYTFDGWNTAEDGKGTAYADGASVTLSENTTLYAQWKSNSSGGYSGGGTTETYPPVIGETKNGKVTVEPTAPKAGDKVTVTATPDEGYEVDAVTVKDADGKDVPVTKNADGTYSYTQPKGKVTVTATFKEKAKTPTGDALLARFTDLDPNGWYLDDVRYCVENGMMNGVADDKFAPNGTTTRAMIVTILYRLEGEPVIRSGMPFSDVKESDWYAKAVSWAESLGIVTGYGDGKFGPNDPITREQLAAILYRYAQYKGQGFQGLWSFRLDFPDAGDVSDWATEAMSWMVMQGVINGMDGRLNPQGDATRVQVAAMVHRFCAKLAK